MFFPIQARWPAPNWSIQKRKKKLLAILEKRVSNSGVVWSKKKGRVPKAEKMPHKLFENSLSAVHSPFSVSSAPRKAIARASTSRSLPQKFVCPDAPPKRSFRPPFRQEDDARR